MSERKRPRTQMLAADWLGMHWQRHAGTQEAGLERGVFKHAARSCWCAAMQVLGVPHDAQETVIRKAYRKLAIVLHPDKNKAERAEDAFKRVRLSTRVARRVKRTHTAYARLDARTHAHAHAHARAVANANAN
eukprot:1889624-Pleurochrysis_carterae.AAC.3